MFSLCYKKECLKNEFPLKRHPPLNAPHMLGSGAPHDIFFGKKPKVGVYKTSPNHLKDYETLSKGLK